MCISDANHCFDLFACSSIEKLKKLKGVVYVGFDKHKDKRVPTHFKLANMYGNSAVLHAYISRELKKGGEAEDDVMQFYLTNKEKTWRRAGLTNANESGKKGEPGYIYVLVRVE